MNDETIQDPGAGIFEGCPECGNGASARLARDWVAQVNAGASIPIVGCGNPWHYFVEHPRMSEAPRPDPSDGTCPACHEVRHDWDCPAIGDGRPVEEHPVYRAIRLGAKLEGFEFPATTAAMGGTLARQDFECSLSRAEAERIVKACEAREWIPAKRGWFVVATFEAEQPASFTAEEWILRVSLRGSLDHPAPGAKR